MRIALKAELIGNMVVTTPVTAKHHPYSFEIYKENEKIWLKVTKPVKDYEEYLTKLFVKDEIVNIHIGSGDIFNDLLEWLQYIEAMGAFNFGVEKVLWDRATYCWIAETDEEHMKTPLAEYTRTPQEGGQKKRLTNSNLFNVVIYRRQLKDLYIPFTYYKEGQRFFHECNYYFAFINFFMMLEYCFSGGKFRTAEMIKNFKAEKVLKLSILQFLSMPSMQKGDTIWNWLENECKHYSKALDFEGLVFLLVTIRGELAHASVKSEKRYRNDVELRPLVVAISTICFLVCGHLQIYGFTNETVKNDILDKSIEKFAIMLSEKEG